MYEPYDYNLGGHGKVWFGLVAVVVADAAEIGCKFRSYHALAVAVGVQANDAASERFTSRRPNLVDSR